MLHNDRQQGTVPGPRDGARTRAARHRPGGGVPARQPNVAAPLDQLRPAALLPRRWAAGAALPPRRSARVSGADRRARAGRLVVSRYARLPAAQLEYWEGGFADARRAGAGELRVVGDISGERLGRHRSFGDLLVYERDYGALARRFGVATLCLYDARRLSGVQAARMLQVHTDMLRETPADVSP